MEKVGFGFFGRPINHKYVSNGLFNSLQLEGETYLNLPNSINLAKGERIVKISRQAYGANMLEIIKVYIFDYAESFNSRSGGFIGSAYVFMGNPTQTLLYNAIKHIHPKVFNLLDETGKFKDINFNISADELINPRTKGLIIGNPQRLNGSLNNNIYTIHTDGPVLNHLMSVVQGFMYNPDFKSLESIYVSDNKDLLKRITRDDKKILGIGHLLNFQKYYQQNNKYLSQKREELQQLQRSIEEEKRKGVDEIKDAIKVNQDKLDRIELDLKDKSKYLKKLESEKKQLIIDNEDLKVKFKRNNASSVKLQDEIIKFDKEFKRLEKEKYTKFQELLEDKRFQSEKEKYLKNNSDIIELKNKVFELKKEKEEREANKIPMKKKIGVLMGVLLILLTIGYTIGSLLPPKSIYNKIVSIVYSPDSEEPDATSANDETITIAENPEIIQPIKEYNAVSFMKLLEKEQLEHKEKLDELLNHLESNVTKKEDKDLQWLFDRKWNFAEILDYSEGDIDTKRYNRIIKLYDKFNKSTDFFNNRLMIPGLLLDNYEEKEIDFKTDKRNEILNEYLSKPKNIYNDLDFDNEGENYNYEEELPLLYTHFRWVVHKLSKHEGKQGDIKATTMTNHIVPIKK